METHEASQPKPSYGIKIVLLALSILTTSATIWLGATDHHSGVAGTTLLTILFMVFGNIDRIKSFRATTQSIEAETREARELVNETKYTLSELRELAVLVSKIQISLLVRQGRMGGYREESQKEFRSEILSLLEKIGVSEESQRAVLEPVHQFAKHDYIFEILGGHSIPPSLSTRQRAQMEWFKLRQRALTDPPSPAEILSFMQENDLVTPEKDALIKDYEYYVEHGDHRRPEEWCRINAGGKF